MSSSAESTEPGTLEASARFPGTELVLLDDDRAVLDRRVNYLPPRPVAAGLYTVRAFLGGNHVDQIAVVRPGRHTSVRIEAPAMGSAMPLAHTGKTHEYHQAAAERFTRTDKQALGPIAGPPSELFLMVREWNPSAATRRGARPERMGQNLVVCDAAGRPRFAFEDVPAHSWGEDNCTARTFVLSPGVTRLRAAVGSLAYEIPLYTVAGWQLQVYVLATGGDGDVTAADLTRAAITMRRIDRGFAPGDFDNLAIEGARSALESSTGGVPDDVLRGYLWEKFENPMLGLVAAHAMLRRGTMDPPLLQTVSGNLAGLLGPIPDVAALQLEVDPGADVSPITTPPMLRASWSMLIDHSVDRPALIPATSLAATIARYVVGAGAWLIWQRPDEQAKDLESYGAPSIRARVPRADRRLAARWLGLPTSLLDFDDAEATVTTDTDDNWCFAWFSGAPGSDRQALSRKNKWPPGSVITVGFLDGDPALRDRVEAVAQEWLSRATTTLSFDFHSGTAKPAVRISFKGRGQWSVIGTTCLAVVDATRPTLNLGQLTAASPDRDVRRKTLHEFGHVLGLIHEHQVPSAPIQWDRAAVMEDLEGMWTPAMIEANILAPLAAGELNATEFDPQSIMIYPIKKSWTSNAFSSDYNLDLSPHDLAFVSEIYG